MAMGTRTGEVCEGDGEPMEVQWGKEGYGTGNANANKYKLAA
jgi:hypothetical protein